MDVYVMEIESFESGTIYLNKDRHDFQGNGVMGGFEKADGDIISNSRAGT